MALSTAEKIDIKNLEWAIWFSQVDLSGLRVGDWINLKEDLYDFIHTNTVLDIEFLAVVFPATKPEDHIAEHKKDFCDSTTETDIVAIQGELKKRLFGFAYPKGKPQVLRTTNCMIVVGALTPNEPFRQDLSFGRQNLQAKVDFALFRRLVSSGILRSQLRTCPECGRIFLIHRKPRTDMTFQCSIRCSRNAATRRYRERLAKQNPERVRDEERERSHRRYVAKQRRKLGAKTKVSRRPRKPERA